MSFLINSKLEAEAEAALTVLVSLFTEIVGLRKIFSKDFSEISRIAFLTADVIRFFGKDDPSTIRYLAQYEAVHSKASLKFKVYSSAVDKMMKAREDYDDINIKIQNIAKESRAHNRIQIRDQARNRARGRGRNAYLTAYARVADSAVCADARDEYPMNRLLESRADRVRRGNRACFTASDYKANCERDQDFLNDTFDLIIAPNLYGDVSDSDEYGRDQIDEEYSKQIFESLTNHLRNSV